MECYYHPDRESADTCAICGKSICKECGLEIAGKVYCKECLEKIVGLGIENKSPEEPQPVAAQEPVISEPVRSEPVRLNKQPVEENIYQPQQEEEIIPAPQEEVRPAPEIKQISDDSPYNIKGESDYDRDLERLNEIDVELDKIEPEPQISQNEFNAQPEERIVQQSPADDFIYPDHSYNPEPTSARVELEDKYEKYLDDLYFDEAELPLNEQLAKDEEEYGSLTRRPYQPRPEEAVLKETPKRSGKPETPEEMEARIRAEILAEQEGGKKIGRSKNIHNLNYQEEKEPTNAIDIILTIILVIVILVVIYYLIYVFLLRGYYPTFIEAIYALGNPQNVINNILTPQPQI